MPYIQVKKCKCSPGCRFYPTIGFEGYFADHHPDPLLKENKIQEKISNKKNKTVAKKTGSKLRKSIPTSNKFVDNNAAKSFEELQLWFEHIKNNELNVCWETNATIPYSYMRAAIAHILPKKRGKIGAIGGFASVSTHPLNYMILSPLTGAHNKFDLSWQSAQGMKVWPLAVERFKKIYPYIALSERKYLPDCLLKELSAEEENIFKEKDY